MSITKPLVSICCITYNHENYIRDAIEGFLMQKTTFPLEIIIHDDASTDGTAKIIRYYAEQNPDTIKPILQTTNQFSTGTKPLAQIVFPLAKGKYIAICEGDDYWTDPQKLQKQVDFMEENPECSMCFHSVNEIDATSKKIVSLHRNSNKSRYFTIEELILGGGGLVGTQSIVFKKSIINELPDFYNISPAGDYPLVLLASTKGGVYYIERVMASYRVNNPHSTMGVVREIQFEKKMERYGRFAQMLYEFNNYSSGHFETAIKQKASQLVFTTYRRFRLSVDMKSRISEFMKWRKYLSFKHQIFSSLLIFPIPATWNQLKALKNGG